MSRIKKAARMGNHGAVFLLRKFKWRNGKLRKLISAFG
jgi:hypothetical protein